MKFLNGLSVIALSAFAASSAFAADLTVGVSWSNFQEERWKTDEAAIVGALEEGVRSISLRMRSHPLPSSFPTLRA